MNVIHNACKLNNCLEDIIFDDILTDNKIVLQEEQVKEEKGTY